jgi:hypothetical protein
MKPKRSGAAFVRYAPAAVDCRVPEIVVRFHLPDIAGMRFLNAM